MLRGERRAYRRGTATGHLSTRHDLTSFLLFPRRLPSSETRRPNRRSKLGGGGEKGGGSLFLANHKRKRSISCQVTRDSSKQESIWFPRTEIHTFPIESIRGFERSKDRFNLLDSPFRKRRPLESAENTLRSQDLRSGGGLRKLRLPSLSCGFERREKEEGQRPLDLLLLPRSNGGGNGSLRYRCRGDRCETGNPKVRGISEFRMLGF